MPATGSVFLEASKLMVCCTRAVRTASPSFVSMYGAGSDTHPCSAPIMMATTEIRTLIKSMSDPLFHVEATGLRIGSARLLCRNRLRLRVRPAAFCLALQEVVLTCRLDIVIRRQCVIGGQRLHQPGRNHKHQLALFLLKLGAAEQGAHNRKLAQAWEALDRLRRVTFDQPGDHETLTVVQLDGRLC